MTVQNVENFKTTVNERTFIEMPSFKKNADLPSCCVSVESPQQKYSAWTDHKQGKMLEKNPD